LSFNSKQRAAIRRWIDQAVPLKGIYFRSVEYRYMDPRDVLSGAGTRTHGGRFAAVGTRAVYLSATDSGASKEVTARKARLGGAAQISTDKYPRVVYAVAVNLKRTLDLSALKSSQTANAIRATFLAEHDLVASMDLARELEAKGIQGLLFPSVAGGNENLVVYLANCSRKMLALKNEQQVIDQAKQIAAKHK
jgi:RES domain-containing protein